MVALSGTAVTRFGRELDPAQMVQAATEKALDDAGTDRDEVEALVVANAAAEAFTDVGNVSVWTATQAGLAGTPALRVETGPSSGLAALWTAIALARETDGPVLALGWEAMTGVPTDEATRTLARLMAPDERASGLSLPRLVALMTSAYLHRYNLDPTAMDALAVKAHRLAASNPIAQFRDPVTAEQVRASRSIAAPLNLMHCAPLSDGAAAVVVDTEGPVEVEATGHATDYLGLTQRRTPPERFQATREAAHAAFEDSRHAPEAVDVATVHDAFSPLEAISLEDLGLAEAGHGFEAVHGPDETDREGPVVNPGGGLKARGHPIGATGLAQTAEAYDQLVGRAPNQAPDPELALVHNIGGFGNNVHVALLEARP